LHRRLQSKKSKEKKGRAKTEIRGTKVKNYTLSDLLHTTGAYWARKGRGMRKRVQRNCGESKHPGRSKKRLGA